jgi:hypothetical protein
MVDFDVGDQGACGGRSQTQTFEQSKTPQSRLSSPTAEARASAPIAPYGMGTLVPVFISTIAMLRRDLRRRSRKFDEVSRALLGLAYLLVNDAKDQASQALIREAAARLGKRRNKRSTIAHLAVDIAFAQDEISPSLRTLYVEAVLGAGMQGLLSKEFDEYVSTGPTGRGGLRDLARFFKNSVKGSPRTPAMSGLACKVSGRRRARRCDVVVNEILAHIDNGSFNIGDELRFALKLTETGAIQIAKLDVYHAAVGENTAQPLEGG